MRCSSPPSPHQLWAHLSLRLLLVSRRLQQLLKLFPHQVLVGTSSQAHPNGLVEEVLQEEGGRRRRKASQEGPRHTPEFRLQEAPSTCPGGSCCFPLLEGEPSQDPTIPAQSGVCKRWPAGRRSPPHLSPENPTAHLLRRQAVVATQLPAHFQDQLGSPGHVRNGIQGLLEELRGEAGISGWHPPEVPGILALLDQGGRQGSRTGPPCSGQRHQPQGSQGPPVALSGAFISFMFSVVWKSPPVSWTAI